MSSSVKAPFPQPMSSHVTFVGALSQLRKRSATRRLQRPISSSYASPSVKYLSGSPIERLSWPHCKFSLTGRGILARERPAWTASSATGHHQPSWPYRQNSVAPPEADAGDRQV